MLRFCIYLPKVFRKVFRKTIHCYHIVNHSLSHGEVPKSWKLAVITPLPKTVNASAPSHYRPVSILPAITKIIERIVQQQLVQYFTDNCLFTSNQHGYRQSHSTETALAVVTERIYRGMDEGCISILVMLDLSKCFDTVDHQRLLTKLSLYGIKVKWFADYLAGHTQQVKVSGSEGEPIMSSSLPNSIGVYQGGSLSCLLYAIYANDMGLYVDDVEIIQFADDTQLLVTGQKKHLADMITTLERALRQLSDWFNENRLKVNASKTQMIVFGTKAMLKNQPAISVKFCGTAIQESRVVKNLGLYMDRHLTFVDHVDHVVAKCSGGLMALTHAKHCLPEATIKPIVTALVISIVRYCVAIYGTCTKTELHRIQKIINFSARVISGKKKFDHISAILKKTQLAFGFPTGPVSSRSPDPQSHLIRVTYPKHYTRLSRQPTTNMNTKHDTTTNCDSQPLELKPADASSHTVASNCTTMCVRVGVIANRFRRHSTGV